MVDDTILNDQQRKECEEHSFDFSGLRALFLNCTLKPSPELSHTEGLIRMSKAIMEKNRVEVIRPVDHAVAFGVYPDMTEKGWQKDDWPAIYEKVKKAHILVIGTPIWLGEKSSVCSQVIERLYSSSGDLNEEGQYAYYGGVGGVFDHRQRGWGEAFCHEHYVWLTASWLCDPTPG